MSETELAEALSPENFVSIRTIYGGTAPGETKRALNVEREYEATDQDWFQKTTAFIENAQVKLHDIVDKITEN
ncbi:MAG: hypothetical protein LC768_16345 [Acidobacteria bacterium]|nr:hypothetical protein [Acidobacteriota bacterium]